MTWHSSRGWQADPVTGTSEPSRVLCLWLGLAALLVLVVLGIAFVPWDWLPGGELRPVVAATYPLRELPAAHESMARREQFGKIVMTVGETRREDS